MDSRRNFGFLELHMFRWINRHLEVGQDVLCDLKFLLERLIAYIGDNLPVAQYRWMWQLQFAAEDPVSHWRSSPLLDTIPIAVLQ